MCEREKKEEREREGRMEGDGKGEGKREAGNSIFTVQGIGRGLLLTYLSCYSNNLLDIFGSIISRKELFLSLLRN